jgi:hypothetical protein
MFRWSPRAHATPHPRRRHDPRFQPPDPVDELDDGFTMFIGPDQTGNLLEVGVVDSNDGPIVVHAMAARAKYLR